MNDADRTMQPNPDHDRHVAFPDLDDIPTRRATAGPPTIRSRPQLSHTTAFPGGRPVRRPATPVRPPGAGRRWGLWVAGAAALALMLGVGGGVHVGVGGGSTSVSVGAEPEYGYDPGYDSGLGDGSDSGGDPAPFSSWTELGDPAPLGGVDPLPAGRRTVRSVPAGAQQLRVEVVGAGPVVASVVVTVGGADVLGTPVAALPWVAEAPVDAGSGPDHSTTVEVTVDQTSGTGTLECRIYAAGTLVSVETQDGPVTCTATLPARSR
ncbi:hypothetical protein [Intrasporangium flavum]|uniref:hypothetical protein n=1 Tax=Intrasporangium flavum TaxID=1428657 RepID=UPI00096D096F|nr:hypothetical protein [Intrasporangium flavum]